MNIYALFRAMLFHSLFTVSPGVSSYIPPYDVGVSILEVAERESYNPFRLSAQVYAETRYRRGQLSDSRCQGLMQVKASIKEKFQTESSLLAGVKYMQLLQRRFGSFSSALVAYNEGPTLFSEGTIYPISEKYLWLTRHVSKKLQRSAIHFLRSGDGSMGMIPPPLTKLGKSTKGRLTFVKTS